MVAYFCHHLTDDYVILLDLDVDLSDSCADLSDLYVDLLLIHVSKNLNQKVSILVPYICRLVIIFLLFNGQ